MNRVALTDGRWFNKDTATRWDESREHDGNHYVSKATGSQWDHERLYRTAGGAFVVHRYSQYQGRLDKWEEIDKETAARWLVRNDEELPEELGKFLKELEI